ncbi:MAG TPA: nitrous oxide reductase accessory protein NosL [Flavobacteriales bacterium]|nr:nitrous oxide reductase accessory protein NosL [Flavobacteriales bacterium]
MTVPHPRPFSRIVIGACALAIISLLYVPIWRIDLAAPQYPEGLALQIFHDRFTGDVQKINGLNHYIGMATIENDMFPEFTIMRYAFYLLAGWGLVAALIGRRGAFFSWIMALFAYVIWAMWDMYAWGYKYGHDLDPHAAIKVEGMAYQPPLFGHKKLLNFDAWSLPDTGGWILFAVISLACIVWFVEWRWPGKMTSSRKVAATGSTPLPVVSSLLVMAGLSGACSTPEHPTIDYGKAECAYCRMNVMDRQFAAAIVTQQGRTYAFDSPECMVQHVAEGRIAEDQVRGWWVCDHAQPGMLIDATTAHYLAAPSLKSPMNGNVAAFVSVAERTAATAAHPGEELDWKGMRKRLTLN